MIVKLPNGLVDGPDLFDHVVIDEIRGKQQNYLANRELVIGNIGHVQKLLEDLVKSVETKEGLKWQGDIKDAIWKFSAGDLETILIKIRENTYGPRFYFEVECVHCGHHEKDHRLDLDKLKLDKMKAKDIFDEKRLQLKLPKSGKVVVLKPLFLKDILETLKIAKDKHDELITSIMALSIKSIDGVEGVKPKDIDDLPAMDLMEIQKKMDKIKIEGTIDTEVEITCANCKKDYELKLDVFNSDFFDPSKGFTSTTT
jgi:hypothetical protein